MTRIQSAIIRSVMSSLNIQLPYNIPDLLVLPKHISAYRPVQKQWGWQLLYTLLTLHFHERNVHHCLHTQFIATYPTYNSLSIVFPSTVIQLHEEQTTECKENKGMEHRMNTPRPNIYRTNCAVIRSADILFQIVTTATLHF